MFKKSENKKMITIEGDPGYVAARDAFIEFLEVTPHSISYKLEPGDENKKTKPREFSYTTDSEAFEKTFDRLYKSIKPVAESNVYLVDIIDAPEVSITVVDEKGRLFQQSANSFSKALKNFYELLQKIIPPTEAKPEFMCDVWEED